MEDRFVGRTREVKLLRQRSALGSSTITALYGRRRIGKTRLVDEAFTDRPVLKFEGLEDHSEQQQREQFALTLAEYSKNPQYRLLRTDSWIPLLVALSEYLKHEPCVVFFDEFQWLAAEQTKLVSELKFVWDNHFQKNNRVHLIICGSVSSFIVKKVVRSKALYGRIDTFLELQALSLPLVFKDFYGTQLRTMQILDYYLAVGGIPKYLQLFDPNLSSQLNLKHLCFSPSGYLFCEIDRLFVSHFGRNRVYRDIVQALAHVAYAQVKDIQKATKMSSGGRLTEYLEELELAALIESYTPLHKPNSNYLKRYRIKDPFLRFYFRFIGPKFRLLAQTGEQLTFAQVIKDQQYAVWKGLAFEQACRDHHALIAQRLGFSGVQYMAGSWFKKKDQQSGVQIDLLFDRADHVMTLCEVKYRKDFDPSLFDAFEDKAERLYKEAKPSAVQKVLVTVYAPSASFLAKGHLDRVLTLDELVGSALDH